MKVTCFKIAALLVGIGILLKCNAADESAITPSGNPTLSSLPDPASLHIQAIDGKEIFAKSFQLKDDCKISYRETFDHPPSPAMADALDKQWASVEDPPGINRRAQLHALSQRIRTGSQGVFIYTLYISKTPKLMMERREDDEWSKGYLTDIYFTGENITEIEPSAGIATIFPPDASRYPELLTKFPMLYGALGYIPDKLQMIPGKGVSIISVLKMNKPVFFRLTLDSSQSLIKTEEIVPPNKKLSVSIFDYSAQSHLWPSSIKSDVWGSDGSNLGHGTWSLLKIEKLPDGFDFNPKIEENYRIVDKTGSKQ